MSRAADEWEAARFAGRRLRERLAPGARGGAHLVGLVLAVLLAAGVWVGGAVWPTAAPPTFTDGTAVVVGDGRFYVRDGGVLHPAPNLASALLLADRVTYLPSLELAGFTIGVPRGIPGAPTTLPKPAALLPADWQLCGGSAGWTLTFGAAPYLPPLPGDSVRLFDGTRTWLVTAGRRAPLATDAAQATDAPQATEVAHAVGAGGTGAVPVPPQLPTLLAEATSAPTATAPTAPDVVCAQSDPQAPFAVPSAASVARAQQVLAPVNNGTAVVTPAGSGVLARQADGAGYWLLTHTAELSPIADDTALRRLGYAAQQAVTLPQPLLELFRAGPELSVAAAGLPCTPATPQTPAATATTAG